MSVSYLTSLCTDLTQIESAKHPDIVITIQLQDAWSVLDMRRRTPGVAASGQGKPNLNRQRLMDCRGQCTVRRT